MHACNSLCGVRYCTVLYGTVLYMRTYVCTVRMDVWNVFMFTEYYTDICDLCHVYAHRQEQSCTVCIKELLSLILVHVQLCFMDTLYFTLVFLLCAAPSLTMAPIAHRRTSTTTISSSCWRFLCKTMLPSWKPMRQSSGCDYHESWDRECLVDAILFKCTIGIPRYQEVDGKALEGRSDPELPILVIPSVIHL